MLVNGYGCQDLAGGLIRGITRCIRVRAWGFPDSTTTGVHPLEEDIPNLMLSMNYVPSSWGKVVVHLKCYSALWRRRLGLRSLLKSYVTLILERFTHVVSERKSLRMPLKRLTFLNQE